MGTGVAGGVLSMMRPLVQQMLAHCEAAHARDVASRMGIDLRDLRFEFEPTQGSQGSVGGDGEGKKGLPFSAFGEMEPMRVRVHVISNASQATIEELGRRVSQECPVARLAGGAAEVKWLKD
eukprot:Hpha_TRINITY_DN3096_c0_g1::TRINITY_DN3096_c0_g1_i2::g.138725::m.138725